jgi:hypothetical protein
MRWGKPLSGMVRLRAEYGDLSATFTTATDRSRQPAQVFVICSMCVAQRVTF